MNIGQKLAMPFTATAAALNTMADKVNASAGFKAGSMFGRTVVAGGLATGAAMLAVTASAGRSIHQNGMDFSKMQAAVMNDASSAFSAAKTGVEQGYAFSATKLADLKDGTFTVAGKVQEYAKSFTLSKLKEDVMTQATAGFEGLTSLVNTGIDRVEAGIKSSADVLNEVREGVQELVTGMRELLKRTEPKA